MRLLLKLMLLTVALCSVSCIDSQASRKGQPLIKSIDSETGTESPTATATPIPVVRPDGEVFIQSDFCSCLSGKKDIISNCDSYCATKAPNTTTPTIYAKAKLGAEIELNTELGTLHKWCTKEIDDGNVSPACFLRISDGVNSEDRAVSVSATSNSFSASLAGLAYNKTYLATLVEISSGAKSDSFQFRRIEPTTATPVQGPLKTSLVTMYTCIQRSGSGSSTGVTFDNAVKMHFLYSAANPPAPLAPVAARNVEPYIYCHDIDQYGNYDSPLFPRLEEIPDHFVIWDQRDIRFADQATPTGPDINELIRLEVAKLGATSTINLFIEPFKWANMPSTESATQNVKPALGYVLSPFFDSITNSAYCPKREHYESTNKLLKVLGQFIGVDTEALYLAQKEPETLFNENGVPTSTPSDFIWIRESLLKQIWFYYQNNTHYEPDEVTATQKTIMFYWPPDPTSPFVKKSTQRLYTIRSTSELANTTTSGVATSVSAPDKRIACIPKHSPDPE